MSLDPASVTPAEARAVWLRARRGGWVLSPVVPPDMATRACAGVTGRDNSTLFAEVLRRPGAQMMRRSSTGPGLCETYAKVDQPRVRPPGGGGAGWLAGGCWWGGCGIAGCAP